MTKLLIVEDEAIVAADLAATLARLGYEVVGTTARGEEAVALARERRPDLVLMDIVLAGPVDGITAAEQIGAEQDVPVVYLTAHSDMPTQQRAHRTNPFGYVIKPFEERELQSQIEMARYRHRIDHELREAKEDLARAQAVAHVGSWRMDLVGNTAHWSDEMYRIFGIPAGTPVTCWTWHERIHPNDQEHVDAQWAAASREKPFLCEHRIQVDGRVKWVRCRAEFAVDGQGVAQRVFGTTQDITGLKEAQQREEHAVAEAAAGRAAVDAVEAMGEGVALLDVDGSIRTVNQAFAALVERDKAALQGQNIRTLLTNVFEEDGATILGAVARVAGKRSKREPRDALSIITARGTKRRAIPSMSTLHGSHDESLGIVLTLRDVTPLIETQENLRESERKYRELVENASSIIMRITPDHRITFFNEYAQQFFGYSADEVLGQYVIGTIAPTVDSAGRDLREMLKAITTYPELYRSNENENMCKDGRRVWVHWSNRAVRDDAGQVREILCIGNDITDRKRLEREAAAYRARLRKLTDRLVAREEHERRQVAGQIHDTVIQSLSLGTMRLERIREAVDSAGLREPLEETDRLRKLMENGIHECRSLMADLTPPLLYEIGLAPALEEFAATQQELHQRRITVEADERFRVANVLRRGLLFQSTRELVMNALKYAGDCRIHIRLIWAEDHGRIEVRDTGKGFDPRDPHLFHYDGNGGFGLFNVRERLEGVGGRLEIDTAPGRGTTAILVVPIPALQSQVRRQPQPVPAEKRPDGFGTRQ